MFYWTVAACVQVKIVGQYKHPNPLLHDEPEPFFVSVIKGKSVFLLQVCLKSKILQCIFCD